MIRMAKAKDYFSIGKLFLELVLAIIVVLIVYLGIRVFIQFLFFLIGLF